MPKGATFDNDWLKLIFNAVNIALIADNTSTTPLTNLFVSLHTADPTTAGTMTTNEANYNAYTRAVVARTTGTTGWNITANTVQPGATISFPASTGTTNNTISFFAIGTLLTGAGKILYTGSVVPAISVSNGVTPQLATASSVTES